MTEKKLHQEEIFHDNWADSVDIDNVMVDESFECPTCPENRYIIEKLGNIEGLKILELGSGQGEASVYFAKKGADVTAVDISGRLLEVVNKVAAKHKTTVKTVKSSVDCLPFQDNSFDVIYTANCLMYVDDLEQTLKEAWRVLKTGGVFYSWDPLAHNPIINIYRKLSKDVHSGGEHLLKINSPEIFKKVFGGGGVTYHTTWLFTNLIFLRMFLFERIDPKKERYWKRIITNYKQYEKLYTRLEKLDNIVLRIFPFLKRYCWNIVVCCEKNETVTAC